MRSPRPPTRRRTNLAMIVGGSLIVITLGIELASRLATGRLFWLNAKLQPVSIFGALFTLPIVAVICLLDFFVWRHQRRDAKGRRSKKL